MPARLKLIVAYDGGPFDRWHSQTGGNTIQDHLEKAFLHICSAEVRVHGAGRTDAGVHALGQCAHVDLPERRYSPARWVSALNGVLPPTIRIMRCSFVSESFHARFSATSKTYRYRIWHAPVLPPLESGRAWHVINPLDLEAVSLAASDFRGIHDFRSFAANPGGPETDTVRTIQAVRVRRAGPCVEIEFAGDGFLYKMVRMMVGTLVRIGLGKTPGQQIKARLMSPKTMITQGREAAPATGLFLIRVRY